MQQMFSGASLVVLAFALGIVDGKHKPVDAVNEQQVLNDGSQQWVRHPASGFSHTTYDVLRVGVVALIVFGVLLIVMGLVKYRAQVRAA